LLTSATRTRLSAVSSGALATALLQSSSATTLMVIGFVSAGLMTFRQSLGSSSARISARPSPCRSSPSGSRISPSAGGGGIRAHLLRAARARQSVGQAVLGFGFVFLGMRLMTEAMTPVTESGLARQVL